MAAQHSGLVCEGVLRTSTRYGCGPRRLRAAFAALLSASAVVCIPRVAATAGDASTDSSPYCEAWAATGECERNPSYMNSACPRSCAARPNSQVGLPAQEPRTTAASASPQSVGASGVNDNDQGGHKHIHEANHIAEPFAASGVEDTSAVGQCEAKLQRCEERSASAEQKAYEREEKHAKRADACAARESSLQGRIRSCEARVKVAREPTCDCGDFETRARQMEETFKAACSVEKLQMMSEASKAAQKSEFAIFDKARRTRESFDRCEEELRTLTSGEARLAAERREAQLAEEASAAESERLRLEQALRMASVAAKLREDELLARLTDAEVRETSARLRENRLRKRLEAAGLTLYDDDFDDDIPSKESVLVAGAGSAASVDSSSSTQCTDDEGLLNSTSSVGCKWTPFTPLRLEN